MGTYPLSPEEGVNGDDCLGKVSGLLLGGLQVNAHCLQHIG